MINFTYVNPTKVIFGKGTLDQLGPELSKYGKRVLIVTGGGSVKRIGLFDNIVAELDKHGIEYVELSGIKPNPRLDSVYAGIELCRQHGVDFILGVGGGSVIDAAKAISIGVANEIDVWKFFTREVEPAGAPTVPLGCVLTLAASGSEMNANAVITNTETVQKLVLYDCDTFPRFSIMDPEYTYSVPQHHTIYGCVDIVVQVLEQYFSNVPNTPLQDRICEGIVKTAIENTYEVIKKPEDYDVRANLMWCGTLACNFLCGMGKMADWGTHHMEEEIGAWYDVSHGAGLSAIFPSWMRYVMDANVPLFKQYAVRVWEIDPAGKSDEEVAREGIDRTEAFFKEIGSPISLGELDIDDTNIEEMSQRVTKAGPLGNVKKLGKEDVKQIFTMAL